MRISDCCSTNSLTTLAALSTVALVAINILALYGHFNTETLSIINTASLGTAALISLANCKSDSNAKRLAFVTAAVVLTICAGLSSLGIFKIFNKTQVAWTVFAPVIAVSGLALISSLAAGVVSRDKDKQTLAIAAIVVLTVALVAINIAAMKGHFNAFTIGIINTTIFGSIALLSIPAFLVADDNGKIFALATFIIFGIMASLAALGISGDFSATSVGWTLFVPVITITSIVIVGGVTMFLCARP